MLEYGQFHTTLKNWRNTVSLPQERSFEIPGRIYNHCSDLFGVGPPIKDIRLTQNSQVWKSLRKIDCNPKIKGCKGAIGYKISIKGPKVTYRFRLWPKLVISKKPGESSKGIMTIDCVVENGKPPELKDPFRNNDHPDFGHFWPLVGLIMEKFSQLKPG